MTSSTDEVERDQKADYNLEVYDFNEFEKYLNFEDGNIYVVNFWATWCAPCIKELPYFEKINELFSGKNVKVILVSLDFPKLYEKKLIPFIQKHNLKSKVLALNDPDSNAWIPEVSESWSGALPATLIYNKGKRLFFEKSFNYEELKKEVEQFLK
jgi:thiol-disulfide isomerase/thioredoxin